MKDHRVYIIGGSGTGKTTLAKAVADKLQIPHFDSDDYYHYLTDPPYQKQRTPEDRAQLLSDTLKPHRSWVLSGGAGTWNPPIDFDPTLFIFLYLPSDVRIARLKAREKQLYDRRILSGGDMEAIHKEFMQWTQGYEDGSCGGTNSLPAHRAYIGNVHPLLKIEEPMTTPEQLQLVMKALDK